MGVELREGGRRLRGERGVALVEFALVFPIFMMIVLGMFRGGQAYDRKLTLTNAAREASRFAATLPVSNYPAGLPFWLDDVADAVEQNATGNLALGVDARSICVAYVYPDGTDVTDETHRLRRDNIGGDETTPGGECFDDGRPDDERRVQVRVERKTDSLIFLLPDIKPLLKAESVTHFEALP